MLRNIFLFIFLWNYSVVYSTISNIHTVEETNFTVDSCFAHIDSDIYVIGDNMPRFSEEIFIGELYDSNIKVNLRYPEFKNLSAKELRAVQKLQNLGVLPNDKDLDRQSEILFPTKHLTSGLNLEKNIVLSRKKGFLNVSFSPIVRHNGEWKRIVSCQIQVVAIHNPKASKLRSNAKEDERWLNNSVLSKGKWVKVRVKEEGIYQISSNDITNMGFTELSKVKVYGYGGILQDEVFAFGEPEVSTLSTIIPDDLVEVPVMPTADNRILFWAEGTMGIKWDTSSQKYTHKQNHYSNYSYYFITQNDDPRLEIQHLKQVDVSEDVSLRECSTVPYVAVYDVDNTSWYEGGRRMFDAHDYSKGQNYTYRIATPDINANGSGTKSIEVYMGAASTLSSTTFSIQTNGTKIGSLTIERVSDGNDLAIVNNYSSNNLLHLSPTENNNIQITANKSNSARLDYIRINYPRDLKVTSAPYSFSPQTGVNTKLKISNANEQTHVWRIGQIGSVTAELLPTSLQNGVLEVVTNTPRRRFVCFDESQTFSTPTFVENVENQNLHADCDIDFVIIIPANGKVFKQAERLGELHKKHDGYTYRVVRADELYNEFSSGTPDANAYRRYLKMLYDKAGNDESKMPKFCLFFGKSNWDNRMLSDGSKNKKQNDYLLCFENDNQQKKVGTVDCYVTDDFFGMLDDGEGKDLKSEKLDIALGRMVCMTEEEAKRLVDKVEIYMNNQDAGSWKNTIVFLGDNGDNNRHMQDCERVADVVKSTAPNLDIQKIYWDRYKWVSSSTGYTFPQANNRIHQLMTEGALVFNYSGHGSPSQISHSKLLLTSDFKQEYSPYMALWILASCEIFPFDHDEASLAEASLFLPHGGSIAFMCATRSVFSTSNNTLNKAYTECVLSCNDEGQQYTMGEALQKAKIMIKSSDTSINKLKYILFGDPALKLAIPTGRLILDSINGMAISETDELIELNAGSVATFSGHVCKIGELYDIDENFTGTVSAKIFDREEIITCVNNKKENTSPMEFTERTKTIFKGNALCENGKFTFHVSIPRDISYSKEAGRISMYALSDDKQHEYNGISDSFCLNGTSLNAAKDSVPPTVVAYINSIENPDYTITDENPILIADISDDTGINNTGISLGHDIELVLDGQAAEYKNLNQYFNYDFGSYQKGQLVYPLNNMSRGTHTAQLKVWDVNNNYTVTDVHFIVRKENASSGKNGYITATKNPAYSDTRFITYFPSDDFMVDFVTYEVYDTRGRVVYKKQDPVNKGQSSASFVWNLCGNNNQMVNEGIYFYRAVITSSNGVLKTDAQKLIIKH